MRKPRCTTFLLLLSCLFLVQITNAQDANTLQPGAAIERTLAAGQTHRYNISLEQDQILQLVVEQRGIDVIVRTFAPTGRRLGEVDTPNGTDGPERVTLVAAAAGVYSIEVSPLTGYQNPSGQYEIKVVEIRKATVQELQTAKNQEGLKARGLDLLIEATQSFPQIRRPETRATFQIRAADLLWSADEKRAAKLIGQAIDSVKEFIADTENGEQEFYESYEMAMQLREQMVEVLAPHDPDMALNFLRATRTLPNPGASQRRVQGDRELQLELSLANQIMANDPKRAFELAEESLKTGSSTGLVETLTRLRLKDHELAAKLAHDIAAKLSNESLPRNLEAIYLASSVLRLMRPAGKMPIEGGDSEEIRSLLPQDEYRDLIRKLVSEMLAYSPPAPNAFTPERVAAQNLVNTLKTLSDDLQNYAPDRVAAIEKKSLELSQGFVQNAPIAEVVQPALTSAATDAAVDTINQAPRETRDQLYSQLAARTAAAGDLARARQIATERITNPAQRQQTLWSLDSLAVSSAVNKGRIEEALRVVSNHQPVADRARLLTEIVRQIGAGLKTATALQYLQQARNMLGSSAQAENQQQMLALLEIGLAFSKYDATRAFEIVEPLVDQFNDLSAAAVTLNGFGQRYYREGELIMNNGNPVAETAAHLAETLSILAMANFDRAKTAADRIRPLDVRLQVYLSMVQQTMEPDKDR